LAIGTALIRDVELKKSVFQTRLIEWGKKHFRSFPWRKNRTPYSVLISEILLRRTTSSAVRSVYERFLSKYPDIKSLVNADGKALEDILAKIGFHKRRTEMLIEMANFIKGRYREEIPDSKEQLLGIPHVGEYTASAVLAFAYGVPTAMVDSNVERIIKRVFLKRLQKKASLGVIQQIAEMLAPRENNPEYNYALLDLGGIICLYNIPKCKLCPVNEACDYYLLGNPNK